MLTREQCVKLRDAGMEQTLKKGDWYYHLDATETDHPSLTSRGSFRHRKCLKIPSDRELVEFVVASLKRRFTGGEFSCLSIYHYPDGDVTIAAEIADIDNPDERVMLKHQPDLDAALYARWEKMTGGK